MKIYRLPDSTLVHATDQFQIGNQKYPPGWILAASAAELQAAGITTEIVADPPPFPTGPQAVKGSYISGLRRKAQQLQKDGDIVGSVNLLLKASGVANDGNHR